MLLLGLIHYVGKTARRHHEWIVSLFRGTFFTVLIMTVLLVAANAVIVMALLLLLLALVFNVAPLGAITATAIGATLGLVTMIRGMLTFVRPPPPRIMARRIPREAAPELWARVDALATRLAIDPPDNLLVGLDPDFFVADRDIRNFDGTRHATISGRTLYCSLPVLRLSTESEMIAVLSHELAHFHGDNVRLSRELFPVYRDAVAALEGLKQANQAGWGEITLRPAIATLGYLFASFVLAEREVSRHQELVADSIAKDLVSGAALASFLMKGAAYTDLWDTTLETTVDTLRKGAVVRNISLHFVELCQSRSADPDALKELDDRDIAHPLESHPPLVARLNALGVNPEDVVDSVLAVPPKGSAIELIPDVERLEESLSKQLEWALVRGLRIRSFQNNAGPEETLSIAHASPGNTPYTHSA